MRCHELLSMLKLSYIVFIFNICTIASAQKDDFALAPGPHRDLVVQNCLACHSESLIIQNHLTRDRWDQKITWMQKTQNLWPLIPEIRSKILDYLERTQGALVSEES